MIPQVGRRMELLISRAESIRTGLPTSPKCAASAQNDTALRHTAGCTGRFIARVEHPKPETSPVLPAASCTCTSRPAPHAT